MRPTEGSGLPLLRHDHIESAGPTAPDVRILRHRVSMSRCHRTQTKWWLAEAKTSAVNRRSSSSSTRPCSAPRSKNFVIVQQPARLTLPSAWTFIAATSQPWRTAGPTQPCERSCVPVVSLASRLSYARRRYEREAQRVVGSDPRRNARRTARADELHVHRPFDADVLGGDADPFGAVSRPLYPPVLSRPPLRGGRPSHHCVRSRTGHRRWHRHGPASCPRP